MKSKKKIVIIILLILAVIIGALAAIYFTTDIFKSPEELFYKYLGKAAKSESEYGYQDMLRDLETANTKSYNANSTIGLEMKTKSSSYYSKKTQATYDEINKIKFDVQTKSQPNEKKSYYNFGIEYDNKNVTNIELVQNGDLYGVKSELLDDKYIAVENSNLKDLAKKLGVSNTATIPDKIEMMDIYKLLYISKDDQDKILKTYQEVLKKSISSDQYKKVENVIQKVNGTDTNTTVYVLGMNEKEFISVLIKLLETLKQDDLTLNLIVDKGNILINGTAGTTATTVYNNVALSRMYSPYSSNSLTKSTKSTVKTELTKEDLVEEIEDLIDELKDEMDDADETSIIELVVYVANGDTVRIELKAEQQVQMAIDKYKENDRNYIVLSVNQSSYRSDLEEVLKIDYKTTKDGDSTSSEGNIVINDDGDEVMKLKFDIKTKGKIGNGTNENSYKFTVEDEDDSFTIALDSTIEYTDNVQIENLNDSNSTILNNMSKTELSTFFNKVGTKFQKEFQEKAEELGLVDSSNF